MFASILILFSFVNKCSDSVTSRWGCYVYLASRLYCIFNYFKDEMFKCLIFHCDILSDILKRDIFFRSMYATRVGEVIHELSIVVLYLKSRGLGCYIVSISAGRSIRQGFVMLFVP